MTRLPIVSSGEDRQWPNYRNSGGRVLAADHKIQFKKILQRIQKTRICFSFRILISRNRTSAATRRVSRALNTQKCIYRRTRTPLHGGGSLQLQSLQISPGQPDLQLFAIRGPLRGEGKGSRIWKKTREGRGNGKGKKEKKEERTPPPPRKIPGYGLV